MKRRIVYLFLAATFCVVQGSAQSTNAPSTPTGPTGPTVKVLAMSRLLADPRSAEVQNTLPYERNAIVRLYLSGKIDQWFVRQDRNGLILVLDVKSVEDARKMLEDLPLDKAKLGTYDLVPLTTWLPLESKATKTEIRSARIDANGQRR